ncbi:MAG: SpoIIIAH-like family protein [Clostridium perfringens]|nr:SpoIIIAH-like family protein [Clostridium perfringens]
MNKKQAGIIVTLLSLIVCVGILAFRVNNGMQGLDLSTLSVDDNSQDEEDANTSISDNTDYFYDSRSAREQSDSNYIKGLEAIIADENTDATQKQEANAKLEAKTTAMADESRIELSITSKGYEEALCYINDNKATVIVKNANELTQDQANEIQDIVLSIAKIYDVSIESK